MDKIIALNKLIDFRKEKFKRIITEVLLDYCMKTNIKFSHIIFLIINFMWFGLFDQ